MIGIFDRWPCHGKSGLPSMQPPASDCLNV
jgi:hypothetical protein